MPTGLAPNLARDWLNVWRGTGYTAETLYIGLHTGDPGSDGTANVSAVTTRHAAAWGAPDNNGVMALSALTTYLMTTTETITHLSAWTAGTGGTFRWSVALDTPVNVVSGDNLTVTDIEITVDPIAAAASVDPDPVGQAAGLWELVFSDEFTGSSLSTTRWYGRLPEEVETNSFPTEVEATDLEMSRVVVSGGYAVATATPGTYVDVSNPMTNGNAQQYKSWMMSTMPRHPDHTSPGFGLAHPYWEVRFRTGALDGSNITNGTPAWPAIWGICIDGLWGDTGAPEWDLLEQFDGSWRFSFWPETGGLGGPIYTQARDENTIADGFHVLGGYMTSTDVYWFLDGVQVAHYHGTATDLPFGFMTNMAVKNGAAADYTIVYDYVRIWQPAGAPAKPVITAVNPGNGTIQVTFNAVAGATSYRAFAVASRPHTESVSTQRHSSQPNVTGSGTTLTIPNVTNTKHYRVCVEAIDTVGRHSVVSDLSAEVVPTSTPASPPNAPTIGTATAGDASATVTFTPAGSGPAATSYTATSSPGSHTATGGSSPLTVTGLTNGTAYTFTVHATNGAGSSSESAASNSVTPSSGGGGGGGTTLAADTFTRADAGSLGAAETGGAWTAPSFTYAISSGKAVAPSGGGFTIATLDLGTADMVIVVDIDCSANNAVDMGLVARVTDDTHLIFWDFGNTGGRSYISKLFVRNGSTSFTGISSLWSFTASTDTWKAKLYLSGGTIQAYVDTGSGYVLLGTGTDTTGQSGHLAGFAQNGASAQPKFDNLSITAP